MTYRQGMAASTDKHVLGTGSPEIRQGIGAFLDKRNASWT